MTALSLNVTEWGTGPRRALVLHGIGSNAAGWWRLGPDLAGLGYHVVAPDLRGHGFSPKAARMLIEDYRDDLLQLGSDWDLVLGHSLGGTVVLAVTEVDTSWMSRLVLQDPAIIGSDDPEVLARLLSEYEAPITAERVAAANPHWHPTDAAIKAEALRQSGPGVIHLTVGAGRAWNYWDQLVGVTIPTLLIGADPEMGALVPPEMGEAAAATNPVIRFETVEGGSHSMHRDQYDAYWALVREFAA